MNISLDSKKPGVILCVRWGELNGGLTITVCVHQIITLRLNCVPHIYLGWRTPNSSTEATGQKQSFLPLRAPMLPILNCLRFSLNIWTLFLIDPHTHCFLATILSQGRLNFTRSIRLSPAQWGQAIRTKMHPYCEIGCLCHIFAYILITCVKSQV